MFREGPTTAHLMQNNHLKRLVAQGATETIVAGKDEECLYSGSGNGAIAEVIYGEFEDKSIILGFSGVFVVK